MGILKRLRGGAQSTGSNAAGGSQKKSKGKRRKSIYNLIPLSEVTEASLEVWSKLPSKIRQDPSMVSFQQEHERLHGEYFVNLRNNYTYL
jgi:hypothetical protein